MALKREQETLENAGEQLLSLALGAGADKAEVCASYGQKTKVSLEKQDFHMASADAGYSFGLRVHKGEKQGFVTCNTTDAKDLKELSVRAVEIASLSPANPYDQICATANLPAEGHLELWDDSLYQVSLQTQKDWIVGMWEEAQKQPKFRINEGSVEISSGLLLVMNSLGTLKFDRETMAVWSLMGMAVEGEKITSFDYFYDGTRLGSEAPRKIMDTTEHFVGEIGEQLNQGPAKNYRGRVLFSPRAVASILLSNLLYHLNGRNVIEGTTRWGREGEGKSALNPAITLTDDPWDTDLAGAAAFDREGVPTQRCDLVREGVIRTYLRDQYAAKALESQSTGHAAGGPASLPGVGAHALRLHGGTSSREALIQDIHSAQGDFLLVNRFSGRVDPITGDFSGVAKGGEWWSEGKRSHFVQETLISGNLFETLSDALVGLSKEEVRVDASRRVPWASLDGVSVTTGN